MDLAQSAVVLSGDDLTRNIGASLGESLASQLGVTASYFGPKASRPIIRGLSGERVLMLLDGVSALDVSNLSPDHSVAVEPLLADQIESAQGADDAAVRQRRGRRRGQYRRRPHSDAARSRADRRRPRTARRHGERGAQHRRPARRHARTPFGWHVSGYSRETDDITIPGLDWSRYIIDRGTGRRRGHRCHRRRVPNSDSESDGYTAGFSWFGDNSLIGFAYGRAETNYGLPGPGEHAEEEAPVELLAAAAGEEAVRIDQQSDRYDFRAEWDELGGFVDSVGVRAAYVDYRTSNWRAARSARGSTRPGLDARLHLGHREIAGWSGTFGVQYTDRRPRGRRCRSLHPAV